jgi:hypothetical protein
MKTENKTETKANKKKTKHSQHTKGHQRHGEMLTRPAQLKR